MDSVEASRIIEATLKEISKQHGIELTMLREAHRPILVALREEAAGKLAIAEKEGIAIGRRGSDIRHWSISERGFGRITKGEDALDKVAIFSIIDSTVRLGGKSPGTLSYRILDAIQYELGSCTSTLEVIEVLEDSRSQICTAFGIGDEPFDECVANIKSLEDTPSENIAFIHVDRIALAKAANRTVSALALIGNNEDKR